MKKVISAIVLVSAVAIAFAIGYKCGIEDTITSAQLLGTNGEYEIYYGNVNRTDCYEG